jgi:hydrogenase maturation protease
MKASGNNARAANPGTIMIIGIGQTLRGDDAAGIEAVRLWQETYQSKCDRPNVQVELVELPGISLLSLLEGSRVAILVDALRSETNPGMIQKIHEDQLAAFGSGSGSAHGWGVAETLALGRQIMPASLPSRLILIGIEAGQLTVGETLSPEVQSCLPKAARLIEQALLDELARR